MLMTGPLTGTVLLPNTRELLEVSQSMRVKGYQEFSPQHTYP